ncbi:DOMON-like domain-containing protein [Uliginosibacterium sp. 31-16]|uniref:DOMON-like domain-containing protein n=1 Tax=Uliginosibacterium sp. 31-16 TaxID=3068315 RepID=UPI00273E6778|nr:DOMON-like domain-containing protein [Uliginosibacterium sp. 31-16]MDP5241070.1 DOMON-like domain-containing protein [Uliginosibacterium sp. 31-16]
MSTLSAGLAFDPDGSLHLRYRLEGEIGALRIPAPRPDPGATDGLWQHSCFELFLAEQDSPAYREFNLAPSGEWAAYAFSTYRQRAAWQPAAAPEISVRQSTDLLELDARLPASLLPACPWQIGLSAVIETTAGALSYWALAHPGERPDFHQSSAFTLRFAPDIQKS